MLLKVLNQRNVVAIAGNKDEGGNFVARVKDFERIDREPHVGRVFVIRSHHKVRLDTHEVQLALAVVLNTLEIRVGMHDDRLNSQFASELLPQFTEKVDADVVGFRRIGETLSKKVVNVFEVNEQRCSSG